MHVVISTDILLNFSNVGDVPSSRWTRSEWSYIYFVSRELNSTILPSFKER